MPEAEDTLRKIIEERNSILSSWFSKKHFVGMAALFGDDLKLFAPNGAEVKKEKIAEFWRERWQVDGVRKVTFKLKQVNVYTITISGTQTPESYDFGATEVTEYFFGDPPTPGGSMKHGWRHRQQCEWG